MRHDVDMTDEIRDLYEKWKTAAARVNAAIDGAKAAQSTSERWKAEYEIEQLGYASRTAALEFAIAYQAKYGWWEPMPQFQRRSDSLEAKIVQVVQKSLEEKP